MRVGTLSHAFLLLFHGPRRPGAACPGPREQRRGSGLTPSASTIPRAPRSRTFVLRYTLVAVLAAALLAVMASPAGATVHRLIKRDIAARHIRSSCPGANLRPTEKNLGDIRAATLCLVNRERARKGESRLARDMRLQPAAQAHTESMAFKDYFGHGGPRGQTPLSRARASGYIRSSRIGYEVGENIGWGTLWEATPGAIVAAWMASPRHRAAILDARFRDTAVGVSPHPPSSLARGQAGAIYTEDFGSQRGFSGAAERNARGGRNRCPVTFCERPKPADRVCAVPFLMGSPRSSGCVLGRKP
jgi:uncharacterized protein YkwD